jgi:para-aminobenzoate synthetase/4-amino-4-deoxychorismate lyase
MPELSWATSIGDGEYLDAVGRLRDAIAAGETYQVNFTWRLRAPYAGDPALLFRSLFAAQPVPHAAWLDLGGHVLCSLSPELFFRRRGELLLCRPMKGTAPRGRFPDEDARQGAALAAGAKERAENLMIVDMVRNDLSRIARPGSVQVGKLFRAEPYASLWQLTSDVTARTTAPLSEVFAALFPAASITGAPKARAMRWIAELECSPRGAYTGAIGWAGPGCRARFNVAIRTVTLERRRAIAEYGTGGGIVWDSTPAGELAESRLKAALLLAPAGPFELLETLLLRPRGRYWLLPEHLDRLKASARRFGFRVPAHLEHALSEFAAGLPAGAHRVRLLLARNGGLTLHAEALPARRAGWRRAAGPLRVALARRPVDACDPMLFHKTSRREVYREARAAAGTAADEVLLWNVRGQVTEATTANLVARLDGRLVTPPVDCGLLAGTLRARLLARRRVVERPMHMAELSRATGLWLINGVRGWMPARLAGPIPEVPATSDP